MAQKKGITEKQVMFTALQKTLCFLYYLAEEISLINVICMPRELLSLWFLVSLQLREHQSSWALLREANSNTKFSQPLIPLHPVPYSTQTDKVCDTH